MINPYEILEISVTATKDEIKASFRKLSFHAHPDHGGTTEAFDFAQESL